jgi:hypothetical protein
MSSTNLADVTGVVFGEIHLALGAGRITPTLETALQRYAAYWKRMGGSAESVGDFVRRLTERARHADAGVAKASEAADRIAMEIVDRAVEIYAQTMKG